MGKSDLDKHLDADEAIVLGASLHAANISDGIKLNRKLGMVDGSTYGFLLDVSGPDLIKDESFDRLLVPRMKKMPIKVRDVNSSSGLLRLGLVCITMNHQNFKLNKTYRYKLLCSVQILDITELLIGI